MNFSQCNLFLLSWISIYFNIESTKNDRYENIKEISSFTETEIQETNNTFKGKSTRRTATVLSISLIICVFLGYYLDNTETQLDGSVINTQDINGFIVNGIVAMFIILSSSYLFHYGCNNNLISVLNFIFIFILLAIGVIIKLSETNVIVSSIICGFTGNTQTTIQGFIDGVIMILGSFDLLLSIISQCCQKSNDFKETYVA